MTCRSCIEARADLLADFSQAFLFGARFEATDLSAVKGLVQAQIDVACGDAKTKLPAALKAPPSWPCTE